MPLPVLATAGISAAAGMLPSLISLISEAMNAPSEAEKKKAAMEAEQLIENTVRQAQMMGQDPQEVRRQLLDHVAQNMPEMEAPKPEEDDGGSGLGTLAMSAAAALPAAIPVVGALRGGLGAAKAAMAAGRAAGGIGGFAKGGKNAYMALVKQAFKRKQAPQAAMAQEPPPEWFGV